LVPVVSHGNGHGSGTATAAVAIRPTSQLAAVKRICVKYLVMGTWGTGIFDSDLARDVRGEWRDGILDGQDPSPLAQRLIDTVAPDDSEPGEAAVFWIALAAAQAETGRLDPAIRDKTLQIIDSGADLALWTQEDATAAKRRQKALESLASKLRGPQPAPKLLRRPKALGVAFDVGDVIYLRNPDTGAEALAVVVDHNHDTSFPSPVIEMLLWEGATIPAASELATLPTLLTTVPLLREDAPNRIRPRLQVVVTGGKKNIFGPHIGRVIAKGINRNPSGDHRNGRVAGGDVLTSYTSWPGVLLEIGTSSYQADLELTRQHNQ
jgi:hypothetical protein